MSQIKNSFLGTGWSFPPSFNLGENSVVMTSSEEDIERSLDILMGTNMGERFLSPDYGCSLRDYVFRPINTTTETSMKMMLKTAILNGEPRINLEDIIFRHTDVDGLLNIELVYNIISINKRTNYVYPFYLNEGTDIEHPTINEA